MLFWISNLWMSLKQQLSKKKTMMMKVPKKIMSIDGIEASRHISQETPQTLVIRYQNAAFLDFESMFRNLYENLRRLLIAVLTRPHRYSHAVVMMLNK